MSTGKYCESSIGIYHHRFQQAIRFVEPQHENETTAKLPPGNGRWPM